LLFRRDANIRVRLHCRIQQCGKLLLLHVWIGLLPCLRGASVARNTLDVLKKPTFKQKKRKLPTMSRARFFDEYGSAKKEEDDSYSEASDDEQLAGNKLKKNLAALASKNKSAESRPMARINFNNMQAETPKAASSGRRMTGDGYAFERAKVTNGSRIGSTTVKKPEVEVKPNVAPKTFTSSAKLVTQTKFEVGLSDIHVKLARGSDLVAEDGEVPDAFAVVRLGVQEHTTQAVAATSTPEWDEDVILALNKESDYLRIALFDYNGGNAPVPIGEAETMVSNTMSTEWRSLVLPVKHRGRAVGKIALKIQRSPKGGQTSSLLKSNIPKTSLREDNRRKTDTVPQRKPWQSKKAIFDEKGTAKLPRVTESGILSIRVVKGRRLRARNSDGTINAFVQITIDGTQQCSQVQKHSISPEFDEAFEFEIEKGTSKELWFEVMHEGDEGDNPTPSGCASIMVPDQEMMSSPGKDIPKWIQMNNTSKYGEILVEFTFNNGRASASAVAKSAKVTKPVASEFDINVEYDITEDILELSQQFYDDSIQRRALQNDHVKVFIVLNEQFQKGSIVLDQSGHGNDAEIHGRTTWKEVSLEETELICNSQALEFADNGYLTIKGLPSLEFSKHMTIEVWAKPYALNGGSALISKDLVSFPAFISNQLQCSLKFKDKTKFVTAAVPLKGESAPEVLVEAFGEDDVFTKTWRHYALVFDGKFVSLFIDAVCVSRKVAGTSQIEGLAAGNVINIGRSVGSHSKDFTGEMGAIRISNVALGAEDFQDTMFLSELPIFFLH
jgi:hypothetical protein